MSAIALVTRAPAFRETTDKYLRLTEDGAMVWVDEPREATPFPSMREAARMAFRLPAAMKAYGLPREPELHARALH